jgi:hypothetical protein
MFNNLEIGKVYWVKYKEFWKAYGKPKEERSASALVRIECKHVDMEYPDAYSVYPMGWDIPYKIHIEDILDVALVENPFKDAREVN